MKRDTRDSIIYVGPSLIVLLLIAGAPLAIALSTSLTDWHLHRASAREFIGMANYVRLFADSRFLSSVGVTLSFTAVSVGVSMVAGFALALLMQRKFPMKNLARALLTIPMIVTPVVSATVFRVFFFDADRGLVNWMLRTVGISGPPWVASWPFAFYAICLAQIWFMTPFVFLVTDAAMSSLPKAPFDAAKIDGAGYAQRIVLLVLPMLRDTLIFAAIFRITIDYRMFDTIYVMTRGGPARYTEVMSVWVYNRALRSFDIGYANAGSVVMAAVVAVICLVLMLYNYRKREIS